jgi:hypothetical protein
MANGATAATAANQLHQTTYQSKLHTLRSTINQPAQHTQLASRGGHIATTRLKRSGNQIHVGVAQAGGLGDSPAAR